MAWDVRLTADAGLDFDSILLWTAEHFGVGQAQAYAQTLTDALAALKEGPAIAGAKRREDIDEGLYVLHVARGRRRGRHFILYKVAADSDGPAIDVLRILHDNMDIARHVPKPDDLE